MFRLSILCLAAGLALTAQAFAADDESSVYAALQSQLSGVASSADGVQAELDTLNARAFAQDSALDTAELRSADWFDVGGSITYRVEASNRYNGLGQSVLFDLDIYTQIAPGVSMSLQLGNRARPYDMIGGRERDLSIKRAYLHITD